MFKYKSRYIVVPFVVVSIICHVSIYHRKNFPDTINDSYQSSLDFENFNNVSGAPWGVYIVPNNVHFIRFGKKNITFIEAVCVLAVLINQRPKKLVIHTDKVEQGGKYWDVVAKHPLAQGVLEVKYRPEPKSIFGQELHPGGFHAGDVARLQILMSEGGIYLDGDSYVVRNLDEFRKFEMSLGWRVGGGVSNQVIIAHKHARFLDLWYNSYKQYNYRSWAYNAGLRPRQILEENPYLVHCIPSPIAELRDMMSMVYLRRTNEWTKHHAIHLMIRHTHLLSKNLSQVATYPVTFNENNVLNYNATIKDMVLAVYPYPGFSTP